MKRATIFIFCCMALFLVSSCGNEQDESESLSQEISVSEEQVKEATNMEASDTESISTNVNEEGSESDEVIFTEENSTEAESDDTETEDETDTEIDTDTDTDTEEEALDTDDSEDVEQEEKQQEVSENENILSTDEAQALLINSLGSCDEETGNAYSFGYIDTVTVDDVTYLAFNWSWLVDNDHMSRLGDIFVAADGSGVYDGVYNAIGDSEVFTEYNYK